MEGFINELKKVTKHIQLDLNVRSFVFSKPTVIFHAGQPAYVAGGVKITKHFGKWCISMQGAAYPVFEMAIANDYSALNLSNAHYDYCRKK